MIYLMPFTDVYFQIVKKIDKNTRKKIDFFFPKSQLKNLAW